MPLDKPLERMNFFTGFFTLAEDWRKGQDYFLATRQLLVQALLTPGIVPGFRSEFSVRARPGGVAHVESGYAVDGLGRDLFLPEAVEVAFKDSLPGVQAGGLIYLGLTYRAELVEPRPNPENPEYSGYAMVQELPRIAFQTDPPDNVTTIELARIQLGERSTSLADAVDPARPRPGEIDVTRTPRARMRFGASFADLGVLVEEGTVNVVADVGQPEAGDRIRLESVLAAMPRYYLVSAQPETPGALISWSIVAAAESQGEAVTYWLRFENQGSNDTRVRYRVYGFSDV